MPLPDPANPASDFCRCPPAMRSTGTIAAIDRPWLGVISIDNLQWMCVLSGLAGLAVLFALRRLELRRHPRDAG